MGGVRSTLNRVEWGKKHPPKENAHWLQIIADIPVELISLESLANVLVMLN